MMKAASTASASASESIGLGVVDIVSFVTKERIRDSRAPERAAFEAVDAAVELGEESLAAKFMDEFAPDILVEGSSASAGRSAVKVSNLASASRVAVVHIPPEPGHSTSRLIERIKQLRA